MVAEPTVVLTMRERTNMGLSCDCGFYRRIAGTRRNALAQLTPVVRGRFADDLSKRHSKGRGGLITHGQANVENSQSGILEKRTGPLDACDGQPLMGTPAGGEAEGGAEVEAAEMDKTCEFRERDVAIEIFPDIRRDEPELPGRESLRGRLRARIGKRGMAPDQLKTQQVQGFVKE